MTTTVQTPSEYRNLPILSLTESSANPRRSFSEESLNELADSIRSQGVLSPLLVRQKGHSYEIVAGARRYRAARLAGLDSVPAPRTRLAWATHFCWQSSNPKSRRKHLPPAIRRSMAMVKSQSASCSPSAISSSGSSIISCWTLPPRRSRKRMHSLCPRPVPVSIARSAPATTRCSFQSGRRSAASSAPIPPATRRRSMHMCGRPSPPSRTNQHGLRETRRWQSGCAAQQVRRNPARQAEGQE